MVSPVAGLITSTATLVTEAPTAEASNTGALPDVAIEAIAPGTSAPVPISKDFFRLVHPAIISIAISIGHLLISLLESGVIFFIIFGYISLIPLAVSPLVDKLIRIVTRLV